MYVIIVVIHVWLWYTYIVKKEVLISPFAFIVREGNCYASVGIFGEDLTGCSSDV